MVRLEDLNQTYLERFLALPRKDQNDCLNALDPDRYSSHRKIDCQHCPSISKRWRPIHRDGMKHAASVEGADFWWVKNLDKLLKHAYLIKGRPEYRSALGLLRAESDRRFLRAALSDGARPPAHRTRARL